MSERTNNEFEISEQTRGDERRLIIIEYEVTRKEINRYNVVIKEEKFNNKLIIDNTLPKDYYTNPIYNDDYENQPLMRDRLDEK